ncbi:hypothetical protein N8Z26_03570 [Burkholderiales bacterium]|nr:hypothetical protein [Burkholderiales bacterium]
MTKLAVRIGPYCCAIFALMPCHSVADWQQLDQTENMVLYLDVDDITKISKNKRGVKNLVDFFIPQVAEPNGKLITFQSFIREIEVDCETYKQKTLRIIFFERTQALGAEVYRSEINSEWRDNPPTSGSGILTDLACMPRSI